MARRLMFDIRRQQNERVYRHIELDFDDRVFRDRFRFSIENVQFITNLSHCIINHSHWTP
jgi:hypothetical protein